MADIELVIKIPEETYKDIQSHDWKNGERWYSEEWKAIHNGTPLPKGHWIHRTQGGGCFWEECSVCHTERAFPTKYCPDCGIYMYADIRTGAPTIIEADKAESEE